MNDDPGRLTETESGALGDLLRGARRDSIDADAIARIQRGLTAAGIVAAATSAASDASALAKSTSGGLFATAGAKIGIAVLALGVAGGAALLASRHPASSVPLVAVTGAAPSIAFSPPTEIATEIPSAAPEPLAAPPPESKKIPTKAALASPPTSTTPLASSPPSANEGALLLQARRVLVSDPARALALVQEHANEFPRSQLAPERDRIAAEARKLLQP
jgi:hypothetical protein